jgi:hypothetical protein
MRRFSHILTATVLAAAISLPAVSKGAADQASPRTDNNSKLAHTQLLDKAEKGKGKIDIYFEGDSIARRWGTSDAAYAKYLANWKENFFGWNAADFGWGADGVQNILWRLQNGELDGVNPKIIVLLGGTNNLNPRQGDQNVDEITRGLKAVVDTCQKKAPDAVIIITGIFPRNDGGRGRGSMNLAYIPIINKINDNLAKMADGKKIRFVNVNDKLPTRTESSCQA